MAQANVTVSLGATLSTPTIGEGLDALLLVDDPSQANQTVCGTPTNGLLCQDYGDGGETFNQKAVPPAPPLYNTFQGISGGPGTNSITFLGVPIDPPASGSRVYRITNVRIQGPSVPAGAFGLTPVYAFVAASSSTSITISQTTQPIVGFVSNGLNVTTTPVSSAFLQCQSYSTTPVGSVTFAENFQSAFKIQTNGTLGSQTQPGLVYYSESGLNVTLATGVTGEATTGTELQTLIGNIPSGVQIYVDGYVTDGVGGTAALVTPTGLATGPGIVELLDNETGAPASQLAVWEVIAANASATDSFTFTIYTSFTGAPGTPSGSPTPNVTATAESGFSPQVAGWAGSGPIPEFSNQYNYPAAPGANLFTVNLCQTLLLFPYVTDYYGFDTGIAISNTSADGGLGATAQTGGCSVAFWGINDSTAGGPSTNIGTSGSTPGFVNSDVSYNGVPTINGTGLIDPGQTWAFSLSNSDSGYNSAPGSGSVGYAIATCNFQYAHGYSFVSDTGIRNFAAAYLALVIPDATRYPQAFVCASIACSPSQPGEQLVH